MGAGGGVGAGRGGLGITVTTQAGVTVTVTVDGASESLRSTRPDVAALLADLDLSLRPEDRLTPSGDTTLAEGLRITVERARPALVEADGELRSVYAQAVTAGEMLAAAGVRLGSNDELTMDGVVAAPAAALPPVQAREITTRYARGRRWLGGKRRLCDSAFGGRSPSSWMMGSCPTPFLPRPIR